MRIMIQGTNLELTDDVRDLVDEKVAVLSQLLEDIDPETVEARVEVGVPQEHAISRGIHRAEINLRLPGKLLRAEAEARTLPAALTDARNELQKQIEEYRGRRLLAGTIGGKGMPASRVRRHKGA
jgi:ribosomal subunit interface protein